MRKRDDIVNITVENEDDRPANKVIELGCDSVELYYQDSKGDISNRRVDVKEVDENYIKGYCHLRKRYRTFRIDRIKEIYNGDTGEKIIL